MTAHDWKPSTLGHGETMCTKCWSTNREAAVLGILNDCPGGPRGPMPYVLLPDKPEAAKETDPIATFGIHRFGG